MLAMATHRRIPRPHPLGNIRAADPTSTLVLRRTFSAQMTNRFRALKGAITAHLVVEDVLSPTLVANVKYEYHNAAGKLDAFMNWLRTQQEAGVLELVFRPTTGERTPWTNVYIQSAYQKGMLQTRRQMRAAGAQIPMLDGGVGVDEAAAAFNQPFHIDRVGLIYTRTYNDLRGVTDAMDAQISRALAAGMAEGRNPRQIASMINKRVDAVGLTRARLIARTEIVHTHNQAAINEMELASAQIDENILVQWFTAQDSRVRPTHQDRHGRVYTRGEGEGLIGEPNCRCALLPYITSIMGSPDKATGAARSVINAVLKKQRAAVPGPVPAAAGPAPAAGADVDNKYAKYRKERQTWLDSGKRRSTNSRYAQMLRAHDEWLAAGPSAEAVTANKMEMLESMLEIDSKVQPSSSLIGGVRKKLQSGIANWVPADLIADMEASGYRIVMHNRTDRAFFRSSDNLCALFKNNAYDVYGHEFSHAIDDFMSRIIPRGFSQAAYKPVRGGVGTGFKWQNNRYVTNAEGAELRGSFKSLHSTTKGKYTNGDGYFWEDNWIDNYEGRIYERVGGDTGIEWWAMNGQRYCKYRNRLDEYGKYLAQIEKNLAGSEMPLLRRKYKELKSLGADGWAARESGWGRVRKSYPKLAEFFERKFGDARFVTK